MSEHTPYSPEQDQAMQKPQINWAEFQLDYLHYPVHVPAIESTQGTTYLIERSDSPHTRDRLNAMGAANVVCRVLPAHTDTLTEDERAYSKGLPHNRALFAKNPLSPQLEREALVFEPTAKSMLDIMIRAGHNGPEIRQARRAAVRGEAGPIVEAMTLATEFIKEAAALDDMTSAERKRRKVLGGALDFRDSALSLAEGLAKQGLDYGGFRRVSTRLTDGLQPDLIKDSVEPDAEVISMLQDSWGQALSLAKTYNTDQYRDGIYTELHKVGDVIIPIPAIASTAWEKNDSGIGYVSEDSGHTLAEIYAHGSLRGEPTPGSIDAAVFNKDTAALVKAYGLQYRGTLLERCRTVFDDEGNATILLQSTENMYRTTLSKQVRRQSVTDFLDQLGIATQDLTPRPEVVVPIQSEAKTSFSSVIEEVVLPEDKRRISSVSGYQMVLSGLSSMPDGAVLHWAGADARRHADIYEALALPENSMADTTLGGRSFRIAARYQGYEVEVLGGLQESITWIIEGDKQSLLENSAEFAGVMQSAGEEITRATEHMFTARKTPIQQRVLVRSTDADQFETLTIGE